MALVLGLESSCDDTAAALVTSDREILAQAVVGQNEAHRPFGGVVPEIAARAHVEILPDLIREVMVKAGKAIADVDAIAATAGPGLIGGVMVALLAGKGLALGTGKPLVAVNHLEGHALSPRLVDPDLDFPYLLLLVSGGHAGSRRPSTMPPARRSTRPPSFSACPIPAVLQSSNLRPKAIRRPFPCRDRWSGRASRIFPSPG
jgi:tRNA A37 threonylcarbamoyltransferase TsaD